LGEVSPVVGGKDDSPAGAHDFKNLPLLSGEGGRDGDGGGASERWGSGAGERGGERPSSTPAAGDSEFVTGRRKGPSSFKKDESQVESKEGFGFEQLEDADLRQHVEAVLGRPGFDAASGEGLSDAHTYRYADIDTRRRRGER
jgi:hypothetical protein